MALPANKKHLVTGLHAVEQTTRRPLGQKQNFKTSQAKLSQDRGADLLVAEQTRLEVERLEEARRLEKAQAEGLAIERARLEAEAAARLQEEASWFPHSFVYCANT